MDACKQLSGVKVDLATFHNDVQYDCRDIKTNCLQIRTILSNIKSDIGELYNLTRGIQSVDKMSAVPAISSADVTEDAIRILVPLDRGLHLTSEK